MVGPKTSRFWLPTLLLLGACAEESAPPLMWEVAPAGGTPSTILGTIHLGVSAKEELPQVVWDRFEAAAAIVVEAELRFIDEQEYLALATLPGGQRLDQLLPSDVWGDLLQLLGETPQERLRVLRPWAVSMMIYRELVPTAEGMDLTLLNEAAGKKLVPLEGWQDQVTALNQVSLEQDLASLVTLVRDREAIAAKLQHLVERYKQGDAQGVLAAAPAAGAVPATTDPAYDIFIRQRTLKWLPVVEEWIAKGAAFVGVGFGHVLGPDGLVELLAGRGYSTRRVE